MACARWHQAITWTNVDLSQMLSSDNLLRAISQEIPQPSITKVTLSKYSFKPPRVPMRQGYAHMLIIADKLCIGVKGVFQYADGVLPLKWFPLPGKTVFILKQGSVGQVMRSLYWKGWCDWCLLLCCYCLGGNNVWGCPTVNLLGKLLQGNLACPQFYRLPFTRTPMITRSGRLGNHGHSW